MSEVGTIYLVHLDRPVAHAQHYLGWTSRTDLDRVQDHLDGRGSPLVRIGGGELVRTWRGTRHDERKLKNRKNSRGLCPWCKKGYNRDCARNMARSRKNRKDRARRMVEFVAGLKKAGIS